MESPYGLLLVTGCQTHQENYARAFAADERCRVIGLTDERDVPSHRRKLNEKLAVELDVPILDDFEAAIARDDVDLVSICAEPERRGRIAEQAAAAGKHLYLDKEPAVTRDGLRSLSEAARASGVFSQTFSLVRSPAALRAKQVVESGRLGTLIGLHAEQFFAKGIAGTADLSHPRQEKAETGRFTFLDSKRELLCVGWYPLVLFQWLTGRRFTSVYGSTHNYFFREHQQNDVEDFSTLLLEMHDGVQATITVGRTGWTSHPSYGVHQIHLVGTDDTVTIDAFELRLEVFSDAPPFVPPEQPHPEDPMGFWSSTQQECGLMNKTSWWPVAETARSDAANFLDCIEQGRESDVPVETGVHTVEVVLAAYEAAASARPVELACTATD